MTISIYYTNGEIIHFQDCISHGIHNNGNTLVIVRNNETIYMNLLQIAGYSIYEDKKKKIW